MNKPPESIFFDLVGLSIEELTCLAKSVKVHTDKARYCLLDPNRDHPEGICRALSLYKQFIVETRISLAPHTRTRQLLDHLQRSWNDLFDALRDELDLSPLCDKAHTLQQETHKKFVSLVFDPEWHTDGHELEGLVTTLSSIAEELRVKISKTSNESFGIESTQESLKSVISDAGLATKADVTASEASINANTDKRYRSLKNELSPIRARLCNLLDIIILALKGKAKLSRESIRDAIGDTYANITMPSKAHREQFRAMVDYSKDHPITPGGLSRSSKFRDGLTFYKAACILCQEHDEWTKEKGYYDAKGLGGACEKAMERPPNNRINFTLTTV